MVEATPAVACLYLPNVRLKLMPVIIGEANYDPAVL